MSKRNRSVASLLSPHRKSVLHPIENPPTRRPQQTITYGEAKTVFVKTAAENSLDTRGFQRTHTGKQCCCHPLRGSNTPKCMYQCPATLERCNILVSNQHADILPLFASSPYLGQHCSTHGLYWTLEEKQRNSRCIVRK